MIYTVTFNPSIDYIVNVNHINLGRVNRTESEVIYPGGKGINVSIVLNNLGFKTKALGFISGFTGKEIERLLHEMGCESDFIEIEGEHSRINIKIKSQSESEINGQGPNIKQQHLDKLFSKLDALQDGDILVLAGSVPNTLPENIYEQILCRLKDKDIKTIVDATNNLLKNSLKYKPFLIKPNNDELEELFEVKITTDDEMLYYAHKLYDMGACNVLVSMAGNGAVFIDEFSREYKMLPPNGTVINSVGAGDSMVAGFLAGYLSTKDYIHALRMGVCTGSASAFRDWLATKDDVEKLLATLK